MLDVTASVQPDRHARFLVARVYAVLLA